MRQGDQFQQVGASQAGRHRMPSEPPQVGSMMQLGTPLLHSRPSSISAAKTTLASPESTAATPAAGAAGAAAGAPAHQAQQCFRRKDGHDAAQEAVDPVVGAVRGCSAARRWAEWPRPQSAHSERGGSSAVRPQPGMQVASLALRGTAPAAGTAGTAQHSGTTPRASTASRAMAGEAGEQQERWETNTERWAPT